MGAFSPEKVLGTPADEFDADGEPDDPPAAPVPVAGEERWHDSSPARRRGELWGNWRVILGSAAEDPQGLDSGLLEF